jgi:uncharacterized membrane protein YhaH (DUF805 family)
VIVLLALFFADRAAFWLWRLFAAIYLPVMIIAISLAPLSDPSLLPLDKLNTSIILSALFALISLGIIAYKTIELRRHKEK